MCVCWFSRYIKKLLSFVRGNVFDNVVSKNSYLCGETNYFRLYIFRSVMLYC